MTPAFNHLSIRRSNTPSRFANAAIRSGAVDAVAFGSDFDGIPAAPIGLEGSDRFPHLVAALLGRGHPADRVIRFVRTNAERVLPTPSPEALA